MTDTAVGSATRSGDDYQVSLALELVDQVRRDFGDRDTLYRYIDAVLYGDIDTRVPEGYRRLSKPMHNPLAVYFTNTITAALTVDPPQVQFPTTGIGESAQANATLREHFFDASWERQEDEAEAPLFRRFVHSVVCRGEGILKTIPRARSVWSGYTSFSRELHDRLTSGDLKRLDTDAKDRLYNQRTEDYKKTVAPYPIRSTDVDPLTYYYWQGEDGKTLEIEHKRVPYLETLVRYGLALDREGRVVPQGMAQALPAEEWARAMSNTSTLLMDEVWDWRTCRTIVSGPGQTATSGGGRGQMARSFRHAYGDPITKSLRGPYAHCLGTTTASRLPDRAGLGVLYGFLDLFVMLDEMLTVQRVNAYMTGLASFKRNRPPGTGVPDADYGDDGVQSARQPVRIEPGYIFPDDVGPVEMPRAGQALGEFVAQLREFLDLILPKVLQGVVDTTDSGYQLALAARLGRVAFDPMVANIRRAMARRVSFESWCIEHEIGETVYAFGTPVTKPGQRSAPAGSVLAIGPDDLNGIHRYRVFLQPEDKASELVEVRKHAEMVQAGFESRSMAVEALGGNWEEVDLARTVERVLEKPEIQQQLDQRILQKIGAQQQADIQAGDQALMGVSAPAGAPGAPGGDGAPGAPPPGVPVPPGGGQPMVGQPGGPAPGSALGGLGNVMFGGQNLPIAPGGPGMPAIPAQAPTGPSVPPGGLPPVPFGAPGGIPPPAQQVPPQPGWPPIG